jgi:cytochrome c peroxidase
MRRKVAKVTAVTGTVAVLFVTALFMRSSAEEPKEFRYIGVKKCKMCHRSRKIGEQYQKWEATEHAKAYEELASDESKKIAKEKGIENPQEAPECLECHTTGYKKPAEKSLTAEEGVSCEACHGPGSKYWTRKVMKDLATGKVKPQEVGFISPTKDVCIACHNEKSPTYKKFDFEERIKDVEHPIPK